MSNNTNSGSFYYLLEKYGLQSSVTSGNNNIATEPLFLVRSGYVYPNGPDLRLTGNYGGYYSSIPNGGYANYLSFNNSTVMPSNNASNARYCGFSLRCLAR